LSTDKPSYDEFPDRAMNYQAAVKYLLSLGRELAAPTQAAAAKFDLQNIGVLAERLGRPDRAYPTAHIAGTNGKGSTAAFLESILRQAGLRTGLYTSPHLARINERIRLSGEEIDDGSFASLLTRIQDLIEELLAKGRLRAHPTYFECLTAMAMAHFAEERVDFAVFEVGLGGRLDATNILEPTITIITRVDFDHENFLGHSLSEIAGEKAGILKPNVQAIVAEQREEAREVILARAKEVSAPLTEVRAAYRLEEKKPVGRCARATAYELLTGWTCELVPGLPGRFQLQNALNAVAAARALVAAGYQIGDDAIARGIGEAEWLGRLEKLQAKPDLYLDGAHNPSAAQELAGFWRENFADGKLWLVYGALRDKAVDEIAGLLFPLAHEVILTEPRTSRAISARQLEELTAHYAGNVRVMAEAEQAVEYAVSKAGPEDAVFVTGSLYLVGQIRQWWTNRVGNLVR
jgi:dihydrofolate synthase / folylpolyglutamate synthase